MVCGPPLLGGALTMSSESPHFGVHVKRDPLALGVIAQGQGERFGGSLLPPQLLLTMSASAHRIWEIWRRRNIL